MSQKTCSSCGLTQDAEKFPSAGWINGKQYRRRQCQRCYWENHKKPRRHKNAQWLEEYKKSLKCVECGNSDHRVLDFHHKDEEDKKFDISTAIRQGTGVATILEEIAKCDCVCANCHRIITYERRKKRKTWNTITI